MQLIRLQRATPLSQLARGEVSRSLTCSAR